MLFATPLYEKLLDCDQSRKCYSEIQRLCQVLQPHSESDGMALQVRQLTSVCAVLMKTILIAEDRESSRELLRTLLEHSGYSVIEATNGAEAILIARKSNPDLVLLDLHMPIRDGFEVLSELRSDARFQSTPILAVTASAMQGDKERVLKSGFSGYLTKPLNFSELRHVLSRLLPQ